MTVEGAARALLTARGADGIEHPGGSLAGHLERVHALLGEWGARPVLCVAGLCHAFYGTDGFAPALGDVGRRADLVAVVGAEAEALVYFYASCDRAFSYPGLVDGGEFRDRFTGLVSRPSLERRRDFAELTVANEIDVLAHNEALRDRHGEALRALFTAWCPLLGEDARRAVATL